MLLGLQTDTVSTKASSSRTRPVILFNVLQ